MFHRVKLWRERHTILAPFMALLFGVVLAGTAYAAWQLSHDNAPGAGKFGTLSASNILISAGTPTGTAVPGGLGGLSFSITNNTSAPLTLKGWKFQNGNAPAVTGLTAPCTYANALDTADSNYATQETAAGLAAYVGTAAQGASTAWPANGVTLAAPISVPTGTTNVTVPGIFAVKTGADNSCQGQSFAWPSGVGTAGAVELEFSSP